MGSEELELVNNSKLEAALKQLKNRRAPGEDQITSDMLKMAEKHSQSYLTNV